MNDSENTADIVSRILPWIIPLSLICSWWVATNLEMIPPYLLPHPKTVIQAGYIYIFGGAGDGMFAGRFLTDICASLVRIVYGFTVATVLGILLGVMSGRFLHVDRTLGAFIDGLRAVPGISWLPLALVWFGIGLKTTVFLVALAAFFPIYLNSLSGVRQLDPVLLRAGAMMGVCRLRATFAIIMPGAMPNIISGLRLGLGISWAYLVLGELTGVSNGLGAVIMDARMVGRIDIIMVGIIIIAVIGRLSDQMLKGLMNLCFKSARRSV